LGVTPASPHPIKAEDLLAHAGFVRGLARALVSGDDDVDDVVQETWLAALGSQDPSGAALVSLARNRW
jgi:DNA-directed RNA polymerase specialized sigma24 family protein